GRTALVEGDGALADRGASAGDGGGEGDGLAVDGSIRGRTDRRGGRGFYDVDRAVDHGAVALHGVGGEVQAVQGPGAAAWQDQGVDVKGLGHVAGGVVDVIHQLDVGSAAQAQGAVREVVEEAGVVGALVLAHDLQLLGRTGAAGTVQEGRSPGGECG